MKIKSTILVILTIILIYPAYLWVTYIDESITDGTAYGFKIGTDKETVYKSLPLLLNKLKGNQESVFIQIKSTDEFAQALATKPDFDVMIEPLFHDVKYALFTKNETWSFYINASFFNSITLKFCENKLCEIRRHRKYFELP
jgi:hypothetical protein